MTSVNGAVVWAAEYGAFGQAHVDAGSSVVNNLRFPGQYYDGESGLHYNYWRYYDSEEGRYFELDPIGLINLFAYVGNNPVTCIDPWGLFTLEDAEDSLKERGVNPDDKGNIIRVYDIYSDSQIFEEWLRLENENQSWLSGLPDCPCTTECIDETEWNPLTTNLHGYHVGATECMRSKSKGGHANQCCYDSSGKLITSGSGSGSADYAPGSFMTFFKHKGHDMDPADLALKLDNGKWGEWSEKYLEVRPQVGSQKCPNNPK